MSVFQSIWLLGVILLFTSCQSKNHKLVVLTDQITNLADQAPGNYAVAFLNLSDTSQNFYLNERDMFHAASTMKTPVLYELYKQQAEGKLKITDSLLIKNEFKSIVDGSHFSMDINVDSGEAFYGQIGDSVTLYDLAYEMITKSNNLATNILIDRLNAANVTESMRHIGAYDILVLRGVEDLKAFEAGLSNRTNAYDLMILFSAIGNYQLVDSTSSKAMLDILLDQQFNDIIPAKLPGNVLVAHKTGSITKVMHDSALVILPDGRKYVLVLLSKDWEQEEQAKELLAEISLLIYEFMIKNVTGP